MSSNIGNGLAVFMTLPVLIGSLAVFCVALVLMLRKKSMRTVHKGALLILVVFSGSLSSLLIGTTIAFGSNVQPPALPVEVVCTPPRINIYEYDGNPDLIVGEQLTADSAGLIKLTDMVYISIFVPNGTVSLQTYYAETGKETSHLMLNHSYSQPLKTQIDLDISTGHSFRAADYFPNGFTGSIWAVITDYNGVEYCSDVANVRWHNS